MGAATMTQRKDSGRPSEGMGAAPRRSSQRRLVYLGIDIPLVLVTITLLVFGLLMVYSASWDYSLAAYKSPTSIFTRQLGLALAGVVCTVFLTFFNYHYWRRLVVPAMGFTILALIAVLIVNEVRNGAVRTLLGGSIQPSELAKIVTTIYLAVWLFSKKEQLSDVTIGLIPLATILGIVGGLIFVQPDLSAVITLIVLGGTLFFLAGGDLRQIALLVLVGTLVGLLVVQVSSTGGERVTSYLAGLKDPTQASYHVRRALESFANGGWFGVGIGKGEAKLTGLPVPHTDSIFAVVGEETGVVGAAGLVGLYILLLWRGLSIARRAPDGLGTLLAAGLSLWIVMEALINMAVIVNLVPFAGNALPFISSGGSNLMVSLAGVGILLNISRQAEREKEDRGRSFGEVVNLRRRDRRRSVSRSGGAAASEG